MRSYLMDSVPSVNLAISQGTTHPALSMCQALCLALATYVWTRHAPYCSKGPRRQMFSQLVQVQYCRYDGIFILKLWPTHFLKATFSLQNHIYCGKYRKISINLKVPIVLWSRIIRSSICYVSLQYFKTKLGLYFIYFCNLIFLPCSISIVFPMQRAHSRRHATRDWVHIACVCRVEGSLWVRFSNLNFKKETFIHL